MRYRIELVPSAAKEFKKLPEHTQRLIRKKIDSLAETPRPVGSEKLSGHEGIYRIRSGNYRVIYQVQDKVLLVLTLKIGHRRDVYKKL